MAVRKPVVMVGGRLRQLASGDTVNTGVVRTWQNVTASRALSTTYTNTSGQDLELNVIAFMASANTALYATINGLTLYGSFVYAASNYSLLVVTVPPGATYRVAGTVATPNNLEWKELRP